MGDELMWPLNEGERDGWASCDVSFKKFTDLTTSHTLVRPDVLNVFLLELAQSSHLDNRLSRASSWEQLMILDLNNYHSAA